MQQTVVQPTAPSGSVLPKINVRQTPEGLVISDRANSGCQLIFLIGFTAFWNLVSWPMALVFWFVGGRASGVGTLFRYFPWIFCIVGLILIGVVIRRLMIKARYEPGELYISTWPLRLGQDAEVRFRRRVRGGLQIAQVDGSLICNEIVSYTVGTDRRTATETVWSEPLPAPMFAPGAATLEATWRIRIPRDAPSSFETFNNTLGWSVQVKLHARGYPDAVSSFPLLVLPEVLP